MPPITGQELLDDLKREFGNVLAAVPEMEKRQKDFIAAQETENAALRAELKKKDDAIAELIERVQRKEKLAEEEVGFRVDAAGRIRPKVSREFADFAIKVFSQKHVRELSESVGADGGFLIAPEYRWQLQQLLLNYGVARQLFLTVPMKQPSMIFPNLVSGMTTYWTTENNAPTESYPQFSQVQLDAKKLMGLTHVSAELLEDANIELGQLILELFGREIAKAEDKQGFLGTGSGGDPFVGVLNLPTSGALNGNLNVVSLPATKTHFNDVTADDILNMITQTPLPAIDGAQFVLHRSIFDVIRKLKTSTGEYIYAQPGGPSQPGTIWGYPYKWAEIMPNTGQTAANTPFITFGNFSHMVLGERHAQEIARSDHFAFNKMQTFIRIHERIGFKALRNDAFTALFTAAS